MKPITIAAGILALGAGCATCGELGSRWWDDEPPFQSAEERKDKERADAKADLEITKEKAKVEKETQRQKGIQNEPERVKHVEWETRKGIAEMRGEPFSEPEPGKKDPKIQTGTTVEQAEPELLSEEDTVIDKNQEEEPTPEVEKPPRAQAEPAVKVVPSKPKEETPFDPANDM